MASQLDRESALYGFPVPGEQWALYSHAPHSRLRQGDKKGSPLYQPADTQPPTSFTMVSTLQKLPEPLPRGPECLKVVTVTSVSFKSGGHVWRTYGVSPWKREFGSETKAGGGCPQGRCLPTYTQIPSLRLLKTGLSNAWAWACLEWHLRGGQLLGAGKQDAVCCVWWRAGRGLGARISYCAQDSPSNS